MNAVSPSPVRRRIVRAGSPALALLVAGFAASAFTHPLAGQTPGAPRTGGWAELDRGAALEDQARPDAAAEAYRAALRLFAEVHDVAGLSEAHGALGLLHLGQSRFDSAVAHHGFALAFREQLGDDEAAARSLNNLGVSHYQWGNYEESLRYYLRSLDIRRALGDSIGAVRVQNNIGKTYHDWGSLDRARATLEEALGTAEATGDPLSLGYTLHNLAMLAIDQGDLERARSLLERSLEGYRATANPAGGEALNQSALALIDIMEGKHEDAIARLDRVRTTAIRDGAPRREARALLYLGRAYLDLGALAPAEEHLEAALALYTTIHQPVFANEAREQLARLYELRGDHAAALATYKTFNAVRDSIFDFAAGQRIAAMEARAEADRSARENQALREEGLVQEAVITRQRAVTLLQGALLVVTLVLVGYMVWAARLRRREARALADANRTLGERNQELQEALAEVRALQGLIPICASCKKVRDDEGFWEQVETYVSDRSHAVFTHGICPDCGPTLFGEFWPEDETSAEGAAGSDVTPSSRDHVDG